MDTKHRSFLTALPTIIVGLAMTIFLTVSYVLFKHRLWLKSKRDEDYMDYFLYTHPAISRQQYLMKDIPVRNQVTVMTNTHLLDIRGAFLAEASDNDTIMQGGMKTVRKKKCKNASDDDAIVAYLVDECELNGSKTKFERNNCRKLRKKSKKKKRNFLKYLAEKAASISTDIDKKERTSKTYLMYNAAYFPDEHEEFLTRDCQISSGPCHSAMSETLFEDDMCQGTSYAENSYYEDMGITPPQKERIRKKSDKKAEKLNETENIFKIKKSDTLKRNAFYDRLTLKQEPKKHYKELVHRDSRGNMSFEARSLPNLDNECNASEVENDDSRVGKERNKSLSESLLHQYDSVFE